MLVFVLKGTLGPLCFSGKVCWLDAVVLISLVCSLIPLQGAGLLFLTLLLVHVEQISDATILSSQGLLVLYQVH